MTSTSLLFHNRNPFPLQPWIIEPFQLKVAKVIPLYKKGDNHLFDNYRPISLLSTVSKIFEKNVFTQVYNYFCAHKLFYESQYGFRKCHSTELAAIELVDRLSNYLDAGKVPVSVFLDLSKAFDTLNHTILIEKLRYYGLNDYSLNWFHSYLHDRLQFTEYNSVCSDVVTLSTGVPQGSILGRLLFIIYMNDIQAATSHFKAILYADDTNLVSPLCSFSSSNSFSNNLSEVTASINNELSCVQEWLLINKLWITVKTLPGRNVTWSKRPRLGQNVHGHQVKTLPAIYVHYSVMNVISEWHSSTNVDP